MRSIAAEHIAPFLYIKLMKILIKRALHSVLIYLYCITLYSSAMGAVLNLVWLNKFYVCSLRYTLTGP